MPSMNPDGFELASKTLFFPACSGTFGRYNGNPNKTFGEHWTDVHRGVDLNRNFKRPFLTMEPESKAVRKWIINNPFLLSISFHGGIEVVLYPHENGGRYTIYFVSKFVHVSSKT